MSIGLEKSTKLSEVFERYCAFANKYNENDHLERITLVRPRDLEFTFCTILQPHDTAESSALMKNDRIQVRNVRIDERSANLERKKIQNEIDRNYFDQMKTMMREANATKCNTIFHCLGKITDENGLKQEVLNPYVKGHGGVLSKRCKWLKGKIQIAKAEKLKQKNNPFANEKVDVQFVPDDGNEQIYENSNHDCREFIRPIEDTNENSKIREDSCRLISKESCSGSPSKQELEDDDSDAWIQPVDTSERVVLRRNDHILNRGRLYNQIRAPQRANEVEFDEDENAQIPAVDIISTTAATIPFDDGTESNSSFIPSPNCQNYLVVTLSHPPEAVKLLLEYCYTNRVTSLGYHAFVKSFKQSNTIQHDPMIAPHIATVGPFNSTIKNRANWPNFGLPSISLAVALAGIQLAEEAGLSRLSYMCECAATILVTEYTSLEALALCESQYQKTGNCLPTLRKTVMMYHLMGDGSKGVLELYSMPSFKRTLRDRSEFVAPSMMLGVMEVMKEGKWIHQMKGFPKKRDEIRKRIFDRFDNDDTLTRKRERIRQRQERWSKRSKHGDSNPYHLEENDEFTFDEYVVHEDEDILTDREGKVWVGKCKNKGHSKPRDSTPHRERKGHANSQLLVRKGSRTSRRRR